MEGVPAIVIHYRDRILFSLLCIRWKRDASRWGPGARTCNKVGPCKVCVCVCVCVCACVCVWCGMYVSCAHCVVCDDFLCFVFLHTPLMVLRLHSDPCITSQLFAHQFPGFTILKYTTGRPEERSHTLVRSQLFYVLALASPWLHELVQPPHL